MKNQDTFNIVPVVLSHNQEKVVANIRIGKIEKKNQVYLEADLMILSRKFEKSIGKVLIRKFIMLLDTKITHYKSLC